MKPSHTSSKNEKNSTTPSPSYSTTHSITPFLLIFSIITILLYTQSAFAATKVLEVNETDFVRLIPEATDADHDKITYSFSNPIDAKGEWQTTYDDEGNYNITITASDGKENTTKDILLIVHHKNQAPIVIENKIIVKETQTIDLKSIIEDPDEDTLDYHFPQPFNKQGIYLTNYNDAGERIITFNVSDGEFTIPVRINIKIENTNQPPTITDIFSNESEITASEGIPFNFHINLSDEHPEKLTILWTWDNISISDKTNGTYNVGYDEAGQHVLKFTASDGFISTEKNWNITIKNTNRAPQVSYSTIDVEEGDKIILDLPKVDEDNQTVNYTFSAPFTSIGEWQTTYDDAGNHNVTIAATDTELTTSKNIAIMVRDVDRAPILTLPQTLYVNEGNTLYWTIDTLDPDGDNISINFSNLPPSATYDQNTKTLTWTPNYDELHRRGGFISDILNTLRLEQYLIRSKTIEIQIESCGKRWCSRGTVPIKIYNTNRAPTINSSSSFVIKETQTITFEPTAFDPDGDIIHYYYSDPVNKQQWTPNLNEQGTKIVYITATDGKSQSTQPINVTIEKLDQAPKLILPGDQFTILEGQEISFQVSASDADGDNVTLRIVDLPPGASFRDGTFSWRPDFNIVENKTDSVRNNLASMSNITIRRFSTESNIFFMRFGASDGEIEAIHPVKITVKNSNQIPIITHAIQSTTTSRLGEPVRFELSAQDQDLNDQRLQYTWYTGLTDPRIHQTTRLERIFKSPGNKQVSVKVSDGRDEIEHTFEVKVLNEQYYVPTPPIPTYKVFVIEHK